MLKNIKQAIISPMSADASQCKAFVESKWPVIQQTLEEYIRIPNQSPMQAPAPSANATIFLQPV